MHSERTLDASPASIDRLADTLFELAGHQDVRALEALAAVFCNRRRAGVHGWPADLAEPADQRPFTAPTSEANSAARRAICRRVARRALRGSLVDPTRGATTMHRIEASPAWSRDLLPIGMFGPFLFYRVAPEEMRGSAWQQESSRRAQPWGGTDVCPEVPDLCWWTGSSGSRPDRMAS